MATRIRFELTIFAVTGRHVRPLHHRAATYFISISGIALFVKAKITTSPGLYFLKISGMVLPYERIGEEHNGLFTGQRRYSFPLWV